MKNEHDANKEGFTFSAPKIDKVYKPVRSFTVAGFIKTVVVVFVCVEVYIRFIS